MNEQEHNLKLNGFHTGYLLFGNVCENCDNNTLGFILRKRIKCLDPGKCPLVGATISNTDKISIDK